LYCLNSLCLAQLLPCEYADMWVVHCNRTLSNYFTNNTLDHEILNYSYITCNGTVVIQ
jgi:hypothetical protein